MQREYAQAILSFSQKMVGDGYRSAGPANLDGWAPTAWSAKYDSVKPAVEAPAVSERAFCCFL